MSRYLHLSSVALLLSLMAASLWADDLSPKLPPLGPLEDAPALLESVKDDDAQRRHQAAALIAHGRLLMQREQFEEALTSFQRGWRFAPSATTALRDIVALSFQLNRQAQAARYAIIQAEQEPQDPAVLRELGGYLATQGDWERAIGLYSKAVELSEDDPKDEDWVKLQMRLGRLYFLNDQHAEAADALSAVQDAIDHPEKYSLNDKAVEEIVGREEITYRLMGEAFLKAGKLDAAAEMFQRADKGNPEEGRLALNLARVEQKRGRLDKALEHLEECFAAKLEDDAQPYELLGEIIAAKVSDEEKSRAQFIERLQSLHKDDPSNQHLASQLLRQLLADGQLQQAESLARKMLESRVTADAYRALTEVHRTRKDDGNLLDVLGEAISKGRTLRTLGEQAEAISADAETIDRLIVLARKRAGKEGALPEGAALAVALLANDAKKYEAADEFFALAVKSASDERLGEVFLTWGVTMLVAEKYELSAQALRRAIDEMASPKDNPTYYYHLAGALEMSGKTEEALEAAQRAAESRPDDPSYQMRVAWIHYHGEQYDKAKSAYREILGEFDSDYSSPSVREAMKDVRINLSTIAVFEEDVEQAVEWLHQALDEFPEDVGALNDLGYLWADEGMHLSLALEMIRKAVAAEPENPAYLDSLGWAQYRLGRVQEAVKNLEKAVAVEEAPDGVILEHLGDAYFAIGDIEKARAAWQRARSAFIKQDNAEKADEVRKKLAEK